METETFARTHAFATLVFAELLRSFAARSEVKSIWRIPLFSNFNLALVVAVSFALQIWSQHSETFGRFLRTSLVSISDCLMLLAVSAIPLAVLEVVKHARSARLVACEPPKTAMQ